MVGSVSSSRHYASSYRQSSSSLSVRQTPHSNASTKAAAAINMSGAAILGDSFINMAYINGTASQTAVLDLFSSDSSTSSASLLDYTV